MITCILASYNSSSRSCLMFLEFPHYSGTFRKALPGFCYSQVFLPILPIFFLALALFLIRRCPYCVTNGHCWIRKRGRRELLIYDERWLASFIMFFMKVLEFCISMEGSIFKSVSFALLQLWCAIYNLCYVH